MKHKRENDERETKRRKREKRESDVHVFAPKLVFSNSRNGWKKSKLSTRKIKKKENTHTHQILSLPRHFKSLYIRTCYKNRLYKKWLLLCVVVEKSYVSVSHFLVFCERIERSRVFARGGFPIGFFLLPVSLSLSFSRRDGLELFLVARGSC